MRTSKPSRQSAPEPLTDAEFVQHIRAAFTALNSSLQDAARYDPNYAFLNGARYNLTLSSDTTTSRRGAGYLEDRRERRTYAINVCFGSNCDVQLRREFFEDVSASEVRVKTLSLPSLLRGFLDFKKGLKISTSQVSVPVGVLEAHSTQLQVHHR